MPIEAAKVVLTFWEVRRIMPKKVPLCLREEGRSVLVSMAGGDFGSEGETLRPGLWLWEREREEEDVVGCGMFDFSSDLSLVVLLLWL